MFQCEGCVRVLEEHDGDPKVCRTGEQEASWTILTVTVQVLDGHPLALSRSKVKLYFVQCRKDG
jgi:hypothetical protein